MSKHTHHIYFSEDTGSKLEAYVAKEFPGKNIISAIVDKAVAEYLKSKGVK
jgi:hypothetical protein